MYKEATTESEGESRKTCVYCNAYETKVIEKIEIPQPVVSAEDTYKCIKTYMVSDDNFEIDDSKFRFEYHIFFAEKLGAEFGIEKIDVLNATVNGGQECEVYRTTNKEKAQELGVDNCGMLEMVYDDVTVEQAMEAWETKEFEVGCCVVSPYLDMMHEDGSEIVYEDFILTIEVTFTNGAVTVVS